MIQYTPSSHSKNSLSKICFKGCVAQKPFLLIGSLTAALRLSKGWVRKDLNLKMRIGCICSTCRQWSETALEK